MGMDKEREVVKDPWHSEVLFRVTDLLKESVYPLLLEEEELQRNAEFLLKPPRTTTIRINTIACKDWVEASRDLETHFKMQHPDFRIRIIPDLPYVCQVNAIDSPVIVPFLRQVIVSSECAQSVLRGSNVFIPGIVGIEDCNQERDVSVWADLEGKCLKGSKKHYQGKKVFIGNGKLVISRDEIFSPKSGVKNGTGVHMTDLELMMPSFETLSRRLFFPQNLPSILAVEELCVEPGMAVIDMCAAPGGKSSHIASKMNNVGTLVSIDKNRNKIAKLGMNFKELDVTCGNILLMDSSKILDESGFGNLTVANFPKQYDRVLLDPPCSGFGQRPMIFSFNSSIQLKGFAEYQKSLLRVAISLLRTGGLLVYSTCTLSVEENEMNVRYALDNFPVALQSLKFPHYGSPGLLIPGLTEKDVLNSRRFWPAGHDDTIGFFYCVFQKIHE